METKVIILNDVEFICLNDITREELEAWFNTPDEVEYVVEDFEQSIGE